MQWKRILSPNWEIQMSSNAIMCRIFLHFAYLTVKKLLVGPRQVMLEVKDLISSHSRLSAFSADYLRQTSWPVCNTSLWWLEPEKADVWQPISQRLRGRREKKKKKKKGKRNSSFHNFFPTWGSSSWKIDTGIDIRFSVDPHTVVEFSCVKKKNIQLLNFRDCKRVNSAKQVVIMSRTFMKGSDEAPKSLGWGRSDLL